jgi:hypothetical protein
LQSTFLSGPAELFALKVIESITKAGGPAELFAPCDLAYKSGPAELFALQSVNFTATNVKRETS